MATSKRIKKTVKPAARTLSSKHLLIALLALIIISTAAFVLAARHSADASYKNSAKSAASVANAGPLHSGDEAVKAAQALYDAYLPLKAQTVASVGDNPNVEPALVQIVRSDQVYFDSPLYNTLLSDYMKQYQATGKVTTDKVSCGDTDGFTATTALASKSARTAVVNVTVSAGDGSSRVIPVSIDLHSLKATKIMCNG